jgi:TonB family protein
LDEVGVQFVLQVGKSLGVLNRKIDFHLTERMQCRTVTALAGALFFILALVCVLIFPSALLAQKISKSDRKVLVSVKPDYSEILRHAQIGGVVRLKAVVSPEGRVLNIEVLGGNPILAESATAAVKSWKYAPAPAQTVEEVSISFSPH